MHASTRTQTRLLSLAVVAGGLLLAACGDDDAGSDNTTVRIDGVDIRYEPPSVEAGTEAVRIEFRNRGDVPHNIVFRDGPGAPTASADDEFVEPGDDQSFEVELTTGEFDFYCSVPGHEEAGMLGTLTVR